MALTKVTDSMLGSPTQSDIALLGFKVAANGSLAKYNLVDQTVDDFQDASGIDASGSTNEGRSSSNYYSGVGSILNAYTSSSGNWTCPAGVTSVNVLVVAGGGGGSGYGGGGGAGGVVYDDLRTVVPTNTYAYSIGAGGAGGTYNGANASNGSNTTFDTITAVGGGGASSSASAASDGGSGGGGNGGHGSAGGSGTQADSGGGTGYGNDGCVGNTGGGYGGGAGGGAGADAIIVSGGGSTGGAGKFFSGFEAYGTDSNNVASTGANGGYFAGGGGGGGITSSNIGLGGVGGGRDGTYVSLPAAAIDNCGGGGGARGQDGSIGGTGGSGIVIIQDSDINMTLVSNSTTAQSAPTRGDIVMTYTNGAGTTTLGTDLTAEFSADGGSTWTSMTLGSEGATGGHNIATAHDVPLTSTSGTSMCYRIKTLNQSASKVTRIQAVSLGWS